jgi:hypothetical protein
MFHDPRWDWLRKIKVEATMQIIVVGVPIDVSRRFDWRRPKT